MVLVEAEEFMEMEQEEQEEMLRKGKGTEKMSLAVYHQGTPNAAKKNQLRDWVLNSPRLIDQEILIVEEEKEFVNYVCCYTRALSKSGEGGKPVITGSLKPVKVDMTSKCGLKKLWGNQIKQIQALPHLRKGLKKHADYLESTTPRQLRERLVENGDPDDALYQLVVGTDGEKVPLS